ncbi:MAG: RusA family crossover junction endodeoxyribonuclease [Candidatus Kariarchaeaceae archaeon]
MPILEFSVEIDPRPKKRPKVYRWSTVNPSEKDEKLLGKAIKSHPNCPSQPFAGQIRVEFKFYKNPPKATPNWKLPYMESGHIRPNKSPDLDNYVKLALDALNGILWEDDRYIIEMHTGKYYTIGEPRIEIKMEQVDEPKYRSDIDKTLDDYKNQSLDTFFDLSEPGS